MSWVDTASDNVFGPQFKDKFDFTLTFEHTILATGPASLLIAAVPIYFFLYRGTQDVVLPGKLLWLKLAAAVALVGIECANLALWSTLPGRNSENAIAAATLTLVSAICLVPVLYLEHRYTLRSTAYMSLWLICTIICDIGRARSLFLRIDVFTVGILTTIATGLKMCLFILEEKSKKSLIKDQRTRKDVTTEATSGLFSRIMFLWMNRVFSYGFKNIISLDGLSKLSPTLATQHVTDEFAKQWPPESHGKPTGSLSISLLKTCKWSLLAVAFPHLCVVAFIVAQPLLLRSVIIYTGNSEKAPGQRTGLVIAAAFIYAGIALSRSATSHVYLRIETRVRGILLAEISKKSLRLKHGEVKKGASVTHMNTDTVGAIGGIHRLHEVWSRPLEVVVNVYILSTVVKQATFLFVLPFAVTVSTSYVFGTRSPLANKAWVEAVSRRVVKTSDVLSQIKIVKMMGLEKIMTGVLQSLREDEMKYAKNAQFWIVMLFSICTLADCLMKPVVIAGVIFWPGLAEHFTPEDIFTALGVLSVLSRTLDEVTTVIFLLQTSRVSLQRIEAYLLLEEHTDLRQTDAVNFTQHPKQTLGGHAAITEQKAQTTHDLPPGRVIEISHAFIAVEGVQTPTLKDMKLYIDRGQFTIVVGPTGAGKSTLLKTILGETNLICGSVYVESGDSAYCDQTPWICNDSIRDNIIGSNPPDPVWYDAVLASCELKKDLEHLPNGDETRVGSNGEALSGGQKQRVALARALFARTAYLLLDDFLAALDRATASQIMTNILGENGLLKRSRSTVILATHSVQFLDMADRIVIIDSQGKVKTASSVDEVIQDDEAKRIINEIGSKPAPGTTNHRTRRLSTDMPVKPSIAAEDLVRQRGDSTVYLLYFRTFKRFQFLFWFLLQVITTGLENFSDAYVRIWVDLNPSNRLLFTGYALIGATPGLLQSISVKLFLCDLAPASAILLHGKLLSVVMRANLQFLTSHDHGSLLNHFSQDMWVAARELPMNTLRTSYYGLMVAGNVVVIVTLSKYTSIGIPIAAVAMYLVQLIYLRTSRQLRYLALEAEAPLCAHFTESAEGVQHIRGFGSQRQVVERSFRLIDNSQIPYFLIRGAKTWLNLVMDSFTFVAGVLLIGLAVWVSYITSTAAIGLSLVSLISLSANATTFIQQWMGLEVSLGAIARVRDVTRTTPVEEDAEEDCHLPPNWPSAGSIVMQDVVARYSSDSTTPPILDNVSVCIPAKSKVGIIGRTGSGKSSIAMALLGFMEYTGTITIDGINISRVPRQTLREVITIISQSNFIFQGTLRENLFPWSIGLTRAQSQMDPVAAACLLERLGVMPLLGEDQKNIDREMSELNLSYGQKQLVGIARSCLRQISKNTKIILLDEATSSLDKETEAKVLEVLKDIFKDCTVLSIAHRTETLDNVNLELTMSHGRLVSVVNKPVNGVTSSDQTREVVSGRRRVVGVQEVDVGVGRPLRVF